MIPCLYCAPSGCTGACEQLQHSGPGYRIPWPGALPSQRLNAGRGLHPTGLPVRTDALLREGQLFRCRSCVHRHDAVCRWVLRRRAELRDGAPAAPGEVWVERAERVDERWLACSKWESHKP